MQHAVLFGLSPPCSIEKVAPVATSPSPASVTFPLLAFIIGKVAPPPLSHPTPSLAAIKLSITSATSIAVVDAEISHSIAVPSSEGSSPPCSIEKVHPVPAID